MTNKEAISWANKGVALHDLGNYAEAIECCNQAVKLDPKDAQTWCIKGIVLNKLRRYDEAIECFDEALRIDPKLKSAIDGGRQVEEESRKAPQSSNNPRSESLNSR